MDPFENPDWDYARAMKVLVRSPTMEWSSSVSSVQVEMPDSSKFWVPNRNMPVEGLTVLIRGEPWKVIDGVGISLEDGRRLTPSTVHYSVGLARYDYLIDDGLITAEYTQADSGSASAGGLKLTLTFPEGLIGGRVNLFFLVDLRPLKGAPRTVSLNRSLNGGLLASCSEVSLGLSYDGEIDSSRASVSTLSWVYKQGYGFRRITERGVQFSPEERAINVMGPYGIKITSPIQTLIISLSGAWPLSSDTKDAMLASSGVTAAQLDAALSSLPEPAADKKTRDALYGRLAALMSFGIRISDSPNRVLGEAGAHWFREVWFRDIYEGLFWNLKTLTILGLSRFIRDQLDLGFEYMNTNGLIPDNLTAVSGTIEASYGSVDSTLLFHRLLLNYGEMIRDEQLMSRGISSLQKFVQALKDNAIPSAMMVDGALFTLPNYSWVDSKSDIELDGIRLGSIPCRVPSEWLRDMLSEGLSAHEIETAVNTPKFLLPEVQALFVSVLRHAVGSATDPSVSVGTLESQERQATQALERYVTKTKYSLPPNLVMVSERDTREDTTPSSPSFSALAMFRDEIPLDRLEEGYSHACSELLVTRRMKVLSLELAPFGMLVQRRALEPYLGDGQYHTSVTWPRDAPYLAAVMRRLGRRDEERGLLLNHLDASVSEAIPFYVNELYGLPLGKNPSPSSATQDQLIPLKNPAQFWSIWHDPYLEWYLS
jgi:hypothetical protein